MIRLFPFYVESSLIKKIEGQLLARILDEDNWNEDGYYIGSMEGLSEGNYYLSYDVERLKKVEYIVLKDGSGNLRLIRHYVNNV